MRNPSDDVYFMMRWAEIASFLTAIKTNKYTKKLSNNEQEL